MDESKANTTMASSSSSSSSSSGGGGSSSSSGTGSKGHVMHANYPMQEPLFYVPPCPSLTKVAEPRPPRRAPVAGYDMKTLRRQVDFLQTEMEEREAVQARLYAQNGELWTYSQSLAEAHARNAALVQAQVSHMHEELQRAHADRYALATQLQRAQESRALLTQLEADLHGARDEHKGIDRLRQEAEAALAGARAENDAHQEMLHRKVGTMQTLHWQLDAGHAAFDEIVALEKAEGHWCSSRVVLRSAYARFKLAVVSRVRLSRASHALSRRRLLHLLVRVLALWRGFVRRRRVMHASDCRRIEGLVLRVWAGWKEHCLVQRLARRSARRSLLRKVFASWRRESQASSWSRWAAGAEAAFRSRLVLRRAFAGWERVCQVREWREPGLVAKEGKALGHFLRRLVRAWRAAAAEGRGESEGKEGCVAALPMARAMRGWKLVCGAAWRRRGRLCKRLFCNLRRRVRERRFGEARRHNAIALWAWLNKRSFVRRWTSLVKQRRRARGLTLPKTQPAQPPRRVTSDGQTAGRRVTSAGAPGGRLGWGGAVRARALQQGWLACRLGVAALRRARVCLKAGFRQFQHTKCGAALHHWIALSQLRSAARQARRARRLALTFAAWASVARRQRRAARAEAEAERRGEARRRRLMQNCWLAWAGGVRRDVALRRRGLTVGQRAARERVRRALSVWKGLWARVLFLRNQEHSREHDRVSALVALRHGDAAALAEELDQLQAKHAKAEEQQRQLEGRLGDKEALLCDAALALEARARDKAALEQTLSSLRLQLDALEAERARLAETERELVLERQREQAMLQEKRAESDRVIARLLAESEALKREAEAARQQAALSAASAREGVQRQEERLLAAEASRDAMQREAAARAGLVRTEGLRQQHLEAELAAVQERLEGVLREGRQQQQEGEGALRTQASAVRVLRESTGLAEARVAELRKMAAEQRSLSGKYDRARLLEGEESELRELDSIRAGLGVTGAGLFPSPGPVPPPPPPPSYAPRHTVSLTPEGPGQHGSGGSGGSGGARAALSRIAAKIGSGGKDREREKDREGEREGKGQRLTGKGTGRGKAQARAPLRQAHSRATSTASTNASISSSSVASSSTLRVPSAAKAAGPARHAIPLAEPLDPYPYSAPLHTGWGDTGRQDEGEGEGEDEDEGEDDGEEEEEEEAGEFDVDESCPSYPSSPLDDELDDALPDGQSAWAMKSRLAVQQLTDRLRQRLVGV